MSKNKLTGDFGENIAVLLLLDKGFKILQKNYHSRYGEIDVIGDNGEILVFAEVKTRSQNTYYEPREAVNKNKIEKIIKTAQIYIMDYDGNSQPRFDVVELIISKNNKLIKTEHIENAFTL